MSLASQLRLAESRIRGFADHEEPYILSPEGEFIAHAAGDKSSVKMEFGGNPEGAILVHNHPANNPFSADDLLLAFAVGLREMRVVSRKWSFRFEVRNPAEMVYVDNRRRVHEWAIRRDFGPRVANGTLLKEEANWRHFDRLSELLADDFGCVYSKRRYLMEGRDSLPAEPTPLTVKRANLFNGAEDTYRTETELNGFRPSQGRLL